MPFYYPLSFRPRGHNREEEIKHLCPADEEPVNEIKEKAL